MNKPEHTVKLPEEKKVEPSPAKKTRKRRGPNKKKSVNISKPEKFIKMTKIDLSPFYQGALAGIATGVAFMAIVLKSKKQ